MYEKISFIAFVTLLGLTANFWAGKEDHHIIQEVAKNELTVGQVLKAKDETVLTLTGKIVRKTKAEHYELKDHTGTINIEVDAHRYKLTDIDVVKVEISP